MEKYSLQDLGVNRKEKILSNNIRLVLFERKNSPLAVSVRFLAGSRYDPENKEGVAHFLEHMLIAGSEKFPSKDLITIFLERYGGSFGLWTGNELIGIDADVGDNKDYKILIEFLSEVISKPLFNDKTIETERGSILAEIDRKKIQPGYWLGRIYDGMVYKNTIYTKETLGTEESVKQINKKDIVDFYENNITGENCTIIASGDIDIETLAEELEKSISFKRHSRNIIEKEPLPVFESERFGSVENKMADGIMLSVGFRVGTFFVDNSPALGLLQNAFVNGRASRLSKKLRYEKGLIYSISASYDDFQNAGDFSINTTVSKENLFEVLKIILEEIDKIIEDGLTDEEIQFTKDKIIKTSKKNLQTSWSWVNIHSYYEAMGKNGRTIIDDYNDFVSVKNEDIKNIAKKYLTKDKAFFAFCGKVDIEEIKKTFKK